MDQWIKDLHKTILDVMDEIHRLSEKHDIHYVLLAGSMLGAIRHDGFIPWDDDLDIGMPRADYDRFKRLLQTELSEDFFYIDMYNHPQYGLPFIKVMKKNTEVQEQSAPKDIENYGVYVDVFPFDVSPKSMELCKAHERQFNWYQKLLLARKKYRLDLEKRPVKRFIYFMVRLVSYIYAEDKLKTKLELSMQKYNQLKEFDHYVNLGGSYPYHKERVEKKWLEDRKLYPFEGREYYGTVHVEDYLSHLYGDYMQLPPVEEQVPRHSFEKLII